MMRIFLVLIPFIVAKRVAIVSEDIKLGTEEREEEETETETGSTIDCTIITRPTSGGMDKGLSGKVRFAIPSGKCRTRCVAPVDVKGRDGIKHTILQQDKQFPLAFETHYVSTTRKCVCKIGVEPRVEFNAGALADSCEKNTYKAKFQCWETYEKIAALDATVDGDITTFQADPRFNFNFEVVQSCEKCTGDECEEVVLPPLTTYLDKEKLTMLALQIEEKKRTGNLTGILAQFDASYTQADKAILKWSIHDTNGDGFLDQDEFIAAYPRVPKAMMGLIIKEIDTDGDGKVNQKEFVFLHQMVLSIMASSTWKIDPTDDTSATLHCVNTEKGAPFSGTGICETTLEQEISKAIDCIN